MHDRNGTPLKVGDIVTLKLKITSTSSGEDFCNVTAESVEGRKPDGLKEHYYGNTAVLVLQESAETP
jgi:hypothetical protein